MLKEKEIGKALSHLTKPERIVLIVTYDDKNKRADIMTAGWNTRTSFDPPLIAVSIGKTRYTHQLIKKEKEFVVAVPSEKLKKAALFCGSCSGKDNDKVKELNLKTSQGLLKAPLIDKAVANFECGLVKAVETGDHTLFIGKVRRAYASEEKKSLLVFKNKELRSV